MQQHTYREYRTWMVWLEQCLERPGITEWYIMQLTAVVRRMFAKYPEQITTVGQKLEWKETDPVVSVKATANKTTLKQRAYQAISIWAGRVGLGNK